MKKYLLPCKCGQKLEVDAGQSGLAVTCACGATLEVPTMRGLSTLAVAESASTSDDGAVPEAAWGPGQGLLFLGTIATVCGIIALGLVLRTKPAWIVRSDQIAVQVERLTTTELWERWHDLRKGIAAADDPIRQQYESDWSTFRRHRTMAAIPLVVGMLLLAAGFVLRPKSATSAT